MRPLIGHLVLAVVFTLSVSTLVNHALRFGGSYFDGHMWSENQTLVPEINFGVDARRD